VALRDLWSNSSTYRAECQTGDDVAATLPLLDLPSARALADVGCGNGVFSIAAARAQPGLKVYAYDALESAIEAYRAALAERAEEEEEEAAARFVTAVAPAEALPLENESVDRVLCRAVLHHIAEPRLLYREIARILQLDGQLLLQAPCNYWQPSWSAFMSEFYRLMDDSHPRQYHCPAQVIADLNDAGLLMDRADCWTYTMNDISHEQRALIHAHRAGERLRLRQAQDGKWQVDFYWVRILARKWR
jgi:SAM-dependent methyltransferase